MDALGCFFTPWQKEKKRKEKNGGIQKDWLTIWVLIEATFELLGIQFDWPWEIMKVVAK
jgi:hypothetical protein